MILFFKIFLKCKILLKKNIIFFILIKIIMEKFKELKKMGDGSFGTVVKAINI